MPVTQLPNGEVVYIDDNATPEAVSKIMAEARKRKPVSTAAPQRQLTPDEAEVQRRVKKHAGSFANRGFFSPARGYLQGYTMSFGDELAGVVNAATSGVGDAIHSGKLSDIGREYRISRDTVRQQDRQASSAHPFLYGAGDLAGALMNPIGDMAAGLKALKYAPLVKAGTKIENAPAIARAMLAGGNQGALNAMGSSQDSSHLVSDAMQGYGAGALTGGVFGGAMHGGRRIKQIFTDRTPDAAKRTAYMRVAQMLDNAGVTPKRAQRELAVTNGQGGDGMVMDLAPGLRAQAGAISRRPNVPSSNDLISRGESRIDTRPELFEAKLRDSIKPSTGQDADAALDSIRAARKGHGAATYESVLDKKFVWNDDLEKFVKEAPPITREAMSGAMRLVENERIDPKSLGMSFNSAGDVVFDKVPSMRVFDYMKRSFNQHIGQALRAGDENGARILSGELDALKAGIAKSNPEYAGVLAKQRDYFQQAEAVNLGLSIVKRLRKEPKVVLKELNALDPSKHDDARTGIVEAIIGLRNSHADPVKYLRSVMRTPTQRKVLEFAFNGKGNLSRFERWMNRERRGAQADVLVAPGRQSETARFDMADESMKGSMGSVAMDALRGYAYGGPAGTVAAGVRKFHDLRSGVSNAAMDEIAKILMSNGAELPEGVSAAQKFLTRRKDANAKAAVAAAKAGQQLFTGYVGN